MHKLLNGFIFSVFALFTVSVYSADTSSTTTTAPAAATTSVHATTAATTTSKKPAAPAVDCKSTPGTINGIWETFFLDTGARSAYVCIQQLSNGHLQGKIIKNFPRNGQNPKVCEKCPGNKQNKPFKGLEILWGFTDKGNGEWVDGHILDAENGDVYTAKASLQGNELHLRGYVGIPLLGKSTVWKKVDKIQ